MEIFVMLLTVVYNNNDSEGLISTFVPVRRDVPIKRYSIGFMATNYAADQRGQ